jgi:hypothetical protein
MLHYIALSNGGRRREEREGMRETSEEKRGEKGRKEER